MIWLFATNSVRLHIIETASHYCKRKNTIYAKYTYNGAMKAHLKELKYALDCCDTLFESLYEEVKIPLPMRYSKPVFDFEYVGWDELIVYLKDTLSYLNILDIAAIISSFKCDLLRLECELFNQLDDKFIRILINGVGIRFAREWLKSLKISDVVIDVCYLPSNTTKKRSPATVCSKSIKLF